MKNSPHYRKTGNTPGNVTTTAVSECPIEVASHIDLSDALGGNRRRVESQARIPFSLAWYSEQSNTRIGKVGVTSKFTNIMESWIYNKIICKIINNVVSLVPRKEPRITRTLG